MNKDDLIEALENERERFLDAIDGLSDEDLEKPALSGGWSIKDVMAHLATWESELVKLLWQVKQGQRPSSIHFRNVNMDEQNAAWQAEMASRPMDRVEADFHGVRKQTLRRIEAFSEKELNEPQHYPWLRGRPLWEWIEGDSFGHEAEHTESILAWRKEQRI